MAKKDPVTLITGDKVPVPARDGVRHKLIEISQEQEALEALNRRVHDGRGSIRTLRLAIEAIQEGYRFDDDMAEAKLQAMSRAVDHLATEVAFVETVLN